MNKFDELLKKRLTESEGRVMAEIGKYMEDEIHPILESHTKLLESHTKALNQIQATLEHHSDNTVKLDKRVTKIEDRLGIVPPPELTITR